MLKKYVPSLFTSLNLLCGCLAAYFAFKNLFEAAYFALICGVFFDLFDGLFARLLKTESSFGTELDSMADLITCGFTPGVVIYQLFLRAGIKEIDFAFPFLKTDVTFSFAPLALLGFVITLGAAVRLAKFNTDTEQKYEFSGLPTPANALFVASIPLAIQHPLFDLLKPYVLSAPGLISVVIVSTILMNLPIRLFSFKIKSFSVAQYSYQFLLIGLSVPLIYFLQLIAIPVIVVLYLTLNVIRNV